MSTVPKPATVDEICEGIRPKQPAPAPTDFLRRRMVG